MTIWGKQVFETLEELVRPTHTALIVIDMQNDFCTRGGYYDANGRDVTGIAATVPKIADLVEAARASDVLTIWIQQALLPDAAADSPAWLRRRTRGIHPPEWALFGTWGYEFVEHLTPLPGEPVVMKHRSSALVGTPLDLILRSNQIQTVAVTGCVTQGCVESTARDATFLDYYVVLVADCVGTTDKLLHEASLHCQQTRYDFATSELVARAWQASQSGGPISRARSRDESDLKL